MSGRHGKKKKKHNIPNMAGREQKAATEMPNENEPEHGNQEVMQYREPVFKPPDSRVAVWTLFTAIVVASIYAFQLNAMLDSNQINRDAVQSVQRAFVYFSEHINPLVIVNPSQPKTINQWQFTIPIKNSGTTPPRAMHFMVNTYHNHDKLPDEFAYPDPKVQPQLIVLGPQQETVSQPIGVAPETIEDVRNRKQHLYFYGWMTYRDVFNKTPLHLTEFCYEMTTISWIGSLPDKNNLYTFYSDCPHHNCTDEECKGEKTPKGWPI